MAFRTIKESYIGKKRIVRTDFQNSRKTACTRERYDSEKERVRDGLRDRRVSCLSLSRRIRNIGPYWVAWDALASLWCFSTNGNSYEQPARARIRLFPGPPRGAGPPVPWQIRRH